MSSYSTTQERSQHSTVIPTVPGIQNSVVILTITNAEIFVRGITTAVTVEEMSGVGMMIEKTRGTAVFHQETISVSSMRLVISVRQEY